MKRKDNNIKRIIISVSIVLAVYISGAFAVAFYNGIYASASTFPVVKDGVFDCGDVTEWENLGRDIYLDGKWEFFYNSWIVTDNIDRESDGLIDIPGSWYGYELGGDKLGKSGYASYKLEVKNLPAEYISKASFRFYNGAYRIFINGKLIVAYGGMSKIENEVINDGKLAILASPEGDVSEIVIEISANSHGGYNMPLVLYTSDKPDSSLRNYNTKRYTSGIAIGIVLVGFAFTVILFCIMNKWYKAFPSVILMSVIALQLIFCTETRRYWIDTYKLLNVSAFTALCLFFASVLFFTIIWFGRKTGWLPDKKRDRLLFYCMTVLPGILYGFCYGTYYILAPVVLILLYSLYLIYLCAGKASKDYAIFIGLTVCGASMSAYSYLFFGGVPGFSPTGVNAVISGMLVLLVFIMYLKLSRNKYIQSLQFDKLSGKVAEASNTALKSQIDSRFLQHILDTIKLCYREGKTGGDEMLMKFSKYLRLHINAVKNRLIPFDGELENIYLYFEMENANYGGRLNLCFDVEETDFFVPVLLLQPLVENSILHGEFEDNDDGNIIISSFKENNTVKITVEDNGKGYDTNHVIEGDGLENLRERIRLTLKGNLTVVSEKGKGTKAIITFPVSDNIIIDINSKNRE